MVCSGRNRPQDSNGQWEPMPRLRRVVGGTNEPEQQLGGGVVQGSEAELVADDQIVAQQAVDDFADAVVGQSAVEGVHEVGGGRVLHEHGAQWQRR